MLVLPTEPADPGLARGFDDRNVKDLAADFAAGEPALLLGEIDEGLIRDRFDETVAEQVEGHASGADGLGFGNALLDFLVGVSSVGPNGAVVDEGGALGEFGGLLG